MVIRNYLYATAASLAFVSLAANPANSAEIRKRVPNIGTLPELKPNKPVSIGNSDRIPSATTGAADDTQDDEQLEKANTGADAKIRSRIPVIKSSRPAEIDDETRIRAATSAADDDGTVAVDSAQSAPSPSRSRTKPIPRIDISTPEGSGDSPRIHGRFPTTHVEEKESSDDRPVPRTRIDRTAPDNIEESPKIRIRTAYPSDDPSGEPEVHSSPPVRKRAKIYVAAPAEVDDASPASPARVDKNIARDSDGSPARRRNPGNGGQPIRYAGRSVDEQPPVFSSVSRPDSVVLKGNSEQQILGGLQVTRTLDLSNLAKNPKLDVGSTTFDFTPVLKNPQSLPNISKQLGAMPDLVQIHPGKIAVLQIPQGVVVTSTLSYSLKPGACTSSENRARILATGVSCFSYRAPNAREAAVAKAGSVEYIDKPVERAKAISTMREQAKIVSVDIDKHVAEFRAMLNDPAERAQLTSSIGAAEVQRMEQLDDTALAGELVNNHDVEIEEYAFIPVMQPIPPAGGWSPATIKAVRDAASRRLAAADSQLAPATTASSYPIAEYNFLTGFTISDNPEWRKRVSTTIRWCLVGCKKTYFAEAWAGFDYGLGMRFPMKFGGQYRFVPNAKPQLDATITMYDGNADDYRSTGLPADQLLNGQEIVAQFGARAGIAAQLPLVGGIGPYEVAPQLKLTDYLPAPFAGGNVSPPMPNQIGPKGNFVLEQVDLLNNYANFGFISAKLHPSVEIALSSDSVGINVAGKKITKSAETITLPVDAGQISTFKVTNPVYNLGVTLTPGVTARMSLNLAVWSASVDWPVTLPAASIKTGLDFGCHQGTICDREYILSPDGPYSPYRRDVKNWGLEFDKYWLPKCLDTICTTSVKLKRYHVVEWAWAQEDALNSNPDVMKPPVAPQLESADAIAQKYVDESIIRKSQKSSDTSAAMGIFAQSIYTPQCQDSDCVDNIATIAAQMGPEAKRIADANPYQDASEINKKVNKEFGPKFVAEVDASKLRASMKQAAVVKKQFDQSGAEQPKLPRQN